MKKIGLFGLSFDSGNLGCSALAYSFSEILSAYIDEIKVVYVFGSKIAPTSEIISKCPIRFVHVDAKSFYELYNAVKKCDIIFDFTEGDSFSDIYGIKRFLKVSITKIVCIWSQVKLVLGPQTYGPFNSFLSQMIAGYILRHAYRVYARDKLSAQLATKYRKKDVEYFIDVAFALPYNRTQNASPRKQRIGINVSGLLWRGGYNGKNQFSLKTDYQDYCKEIIGFCLANGYEVYLIPHVITKNINNRENDYTVSCDIKKLFPELILAPKFESPIAAKSYISTMDIFIGARMHATIGAFSSGVCTIPFSYSKKFEGLYETIGYPYVIHGLKNTTKESVEQTIAYIKKASMLKKVQKKAMDYCNMQIDIFKDELEKILLDM